ncbi:MAG: bifunctional folylpolyglutamate synthase/dihydrofolate synthase [Moraxellaceae bacterium]|nr:MAG: bifunctional folylpolyglutamate synthase/dihydrofolate synthase [Moraxellaceae bacterium]
MPRTLNDWLSQLELLHPTEIELGLDRISSVYQRLAVAEVLPTVVVVGGTNGKGSTVTLIEKIALAHGLSVGAYTSPHLFHYNERVRINGVPVSDELLVDAFERVEGCRGDVSLTYFEFGTLAALIVFADAGLDLVILEVGLGGRLDAVNIVESDLSVVTSIDIDHTDWLGDNRDIIAYEKAGIARPGKPLICGELDVPRTLTDHVQRVNSMGYYYGADFGSGKGIDIGPDSGDEYFYLDAVGESRVVQQTSVARLHIANVACAIQACALVVPGFSPEKAELIAASTQVAGRQQWLSLNHSGVNNVIVDVGHNPHAARSLAQELSRVLIGDPVQGRQFDNVYCLIAMMSDKDIASVVDSLSPWVNHWLVSGLPGVARAESPDTLKRILFDKSLPVYGSFVQPSAALDSLVDNKLLNIGQDSTNLLVVFGSFYMAAAALDYFSVSANYAND